MTVIKGYCHINKEDCWVNGKPVLAKTDDPEYSWLRQIYNFVGLSYPKFHKMDQLAQAGVLALALLKHEGDLPMDYSEEGVDLVLANRHASAGSDLRFQASYADHAAPSPALFVYTLPNIVLGEIAIQQKWYGDHIFVVLPAFDPDFFIQYAQRHIQQGCQAVIGGWLEVTDTETDVFLFLAEAEESTGKGGSLPLAAINELYRQPMPSISKL
ncbi:hypothetical protein CLV98_104422 [Dyadobacter jejuensis]|uniref:Beta-ketoacyl synthase-like protein n=1 Tax=Dyadobacter jejuensis TaxID=1082580 RepID=A0A316AM06_9BACT|nr:hypothetical protein [Dyadobacter jejuensis]PWJ58562.1 hypothetical protein CLV98_104422 [Dyadobacter jejuensis]